MARAYDDDLRRKILQAYARSRATFRELAERFGVSVGYVYNIRQQQLRSGKMERIPQSHNGRPSRLTLGIRQQMRTWITAQPDLTLLELKHQLQERCAVQVGIGQIWLVLQAMGLRLKKSHSTRKSKILRKRNRSGRVGGRRSAR